MAKMRPPPGVRKPPKASAAKKMAASRGKMMLRRVLRIAIPIIILAVIALVVYFVFFKKPKPEAIVKKAVECSINGHSACFRELFTDDSIALLESSWASNEQKIGSWEEMMDGLLTSAYKSPKIHDGVVEEHQGIKTATVEVDIDGVTRIIHLRQQKGLWRMTVNVPMDPDAIELPAGVPEIALKNTSTEEEKEEVDWWARDPDAEEPESATAKKKGKSRASKYGRRASSRVMGRLRRIIRF